MVVDNELFVRFRGGVQYQTHLITFYKHIMTHTHSTLDIHHALALTITTQIL